MYIQPLFDVYKRFAWSEKCKQVRRDLGRDVSDLMEMWEKLEQAAARPELYATIPVKIASNGHRAIVTLTDPLVTTPLPRNVTNALLVIPLEFYSATTEVTSNAAS